MPADEKKVEAAEGEVSNLIETLIVEATKDDVPPRLRALARELEAALDRRARSWKTSSH